MSKCVACGKENHNGCDVCDACQEDAWEQEWYEQQREEEEEYWRRTEEENRYDQGNF